MRLNIIVILLIFCGTHLSAQLNIRLGYNLPTVTSASFTNQSIKTSKGYQIGFSYLDQIGNKFSARPGILYSTKGFKTKIGDEFSTTSFTYLEIPFDLVYTISTSENSAFNLHAGPYYGLMLNGKYKFQGETTDIDLSSGTLKRGDLGLNFGFTFDLNSVFIGFNYGLALSNLNPFSDDPVKNRNIALIAGYIFGGSNSSVQSQ